RGQSVHATHPRPRTAHAQPENRGFDDDDDRHGGTAPSFAAAHQQNLLSLGGPATGLRGPGPNHPRANFVVEAEIWPNFLWRARDRRIPLFLANARLSSRSYRGYRRFGFLFRPLFAAFAGVS